MKALLLTILLASTAVAQNYVETVSPVDYPTNHLTPKYVKCNGQLIELPGNTQLPITCDEAIALQGSLGCPAFASSCDNTINKIIRCYDKYSSKKKRAKCVAE